MERTGDWPMKAIDLDPVAALPSAFPAARRPSTRAREAGWVADSLFGEPRYVHRRLHRRESRAVGNFRAESVTEDGEALRHDDQFWRRGGSSMATATARWALLSRTRRISAMTSSSLAAQLQIRGRRRG